jgi:quercetin dioxygenase-like cupin family protein
VEEINMGTVLLSFENKIPDVKPARSVNFRGGFIKFHADSTDTSGQFALLETKGGPGGEPPLHVHRNEDELFYVLEGQLKVLRGNEEITLSPGQSAFLPRNVAHRFKIVSSQARFLVYITPGGFEAYFRDLGHPVDDDGNSEEPQTELSVAELLRVAGRYSVTFMP